MASYRRFNGAFLNILSALNEPVLSLLLSARVYIGLFICFLIWEILQTLLNDLA